METTSLVLFLSGVHKIFHKTYILEALQNTLKECFMQNKCV